MSCNGCRVLRKGCSDGCVLRPCLQWIDAADAQGHATVFVAKFFGRAGLLSFISAVPDAQRPALFQSLLYEAAGRTINPVHGAVGLLWTSNWHLCQAAVDTVLRGGAIGPLPEANRSGAAAFSTAKRVRNPPAPSCDLGLCLLSHGSPQALRPVTPSMSSDESVTTTTGGGERDPVLLNLFL
uniref:LOB domain-containing protein n=1 Tax=Leersia perrieri TaxID=77586 RepID=A0A0D9VVM2_9ORYZ